MKRTLIILLTLFVTLSGFAQDPTEIVRKAYLKMEGESQYALMTMQVVRPKWTRTVKFKFASKGTDYALVLIIYPAKEQGQTFLMIKNQMWMYNPQVNSLIKLGPSMMSQGWMGSDYSNDELLNEGSIVKDYNHKILGEETIENRPCWKIELTPKSGTNIVWGKQIMWIDKKDYLILKTELYDEDGYLVKTQLASDIKNMHGRVIPTKFTIIPEEEPDNKTILTIDDIRFNVNIPNSFFTIQNMRRGMNINFNF